MFLGATAAILVAGGAILGLVLTHSLETQAISDREESLTRYVSGVLRPDLVQDGRILVKPKAESRILEELRGYPDLISIKVWRPDGTLAWTNVGRSRIGKRFPLDGELGETIRENRAAGSIEPLKPLGEDAFESRLARERGVGSVFEVYTPIVAGDGRVIGAYALYADAESLEGFIASGKRVIWLTVALVFAALGFALALLVRTSSRTMRRQSITLRERSKALFDSYRRLEESALQAIESLNATVEAKDPDTAGHSRRVQTIALRIGRELDLSRSQLDAIRFGALFHDIGKIAVPDAVLTKPGGLSHEEFADFQRHVVQGAHIVERFGRLKDAVPVILHHHERWDGKGYPNGLAGETIPIEAAVVGVADAYDAMTTDRPYARALLEDEAVSEIRAGRGTQFSPVVVDAFFALMRRGELSKEAPPASLRASAG
jgi:putative nucleotidyltransferase with HDIG domain